MHSAADWTRSLRATHIGVGLITTRCGRSDSNWPNNTRDTTSSKRISESLVLEDYTVVLDLIEMSWSFVADRDVSSAEALTAKINGLFADYGLGYKVHDGQVLRVDTPVLTELAIEPALTLLSEPGFEQADKEFRTALDHLKSNRAADAVAWANASFESTMKVILDARKISVDEKKET